MNGGMKWFLVGSLAGVVVGSYLYRMQRDEEARGTKYAPASMRDRAMDTLNRAEQRVKKTIPVGNRSLKLIRRLNW